MPPNRSETLILMVSVPSHSQVSQLDQMSGIKTKGGGGGAM